MWVLDLNGAKNDEYVEAMKARPLGPAYEIFEELGGRYYDDLRQCPELEEIRRSFTLRTRPQL